MKALILAAGVGSRLRPLTEATPKALIPVAGVAMLERVAVRLKQAGATALVVNAHHHAQEVAGFCTELSRRLAMPISVSHEDKALLGTGGALLNAAALLRGSEPFFVHNADVLTDLDLTALYAAHLQSGALATLCVRERDSERAYLFDAQGRFVGHDNSKSGTRWTGKPLASAQRLAFDGIHVISASMLDQITEAGFFSITETYLRLAAHGADIWAFRTDRWGWHDIGSPEKLAAAEAWARSRH